MRKPLSIFFLLIIVSCSQKQTISEKKQWIAGYWEIEQVLFKGEKKEYSISNTVDLFYIENDISGYRKKVSPT